MTDKRVRTRFAPSPTGMLHIGGARTAIYNWAFARAEGGDFILRIEDTDPERSTEENTQIILRALRWLGLDWDEGPDAGGAVGPYFQTERTASYKACLEKLIETENAYPCFCTKEEIEQKRLEAEKTEGGYSGYDGTCRDIPKDEALKKIGEGVPHVWRLKVPKDHAPIEVDDKVYGHVTFPADVMDDLILVRTDGIPTYNFANVCDDANMGITHVIRGDDHLSNTPRQILIYEALGFDVPEFAHLPMILGTNGKKLSKRHGAASVEEYRDLGYLPDALVNYLALLGWSLDGETTIVPPAELEHEFSLDRVSKKDSVFDIQKLDWMDGVYIRELDTGKWLTIATPWLALAKINGGNAPLGASIKCAEPQNEGADNSVKGAQPGDVTPLVIQAPGSDVDPEIWQKALADVSDNSDFYLALHPLVVERMSRFNELPSKLEYMFWGSNVVLDEKSVQKVLKKEGAQADKALLICRGVLADESIAWECDALQERCRALGEEAGLKPKLLFQPLRVAICGNMVSPPLFESIELLDRKDMLARIDAVLETVFA